MNSYKEDRTRFEVITLLSGRISGNYSSLSDVSKSYIREALRIVDEIDEIMDERRNRNESSS